LTRILIADDHPIALMAVRTVLELDGGFEIVAEAQTGSQVLPLVGRTQPELVLLDLAMPGVHGLRVLELMRERFPQVQAIVFSGCDERAQIDRALRLGARGYLLKTLAIADLPSILRENLAGHLYFAPDGWAEQVQQGTIRETGLTNKELEILAGVAEGLSNREIAKRLWLSAETVKSHLSSIYRKLDVNSRVAAARVAYEEHLIDSPADRVAAAH
jgi:two-component system, NarL family, nitrate/nitrite response regulator NarP